MGRLKSVTQLSCPNCKFNQYMLWSFNGILIYKCLLCGHEGPLCEVL